MSESVFVINLLHDLPSWVLVGLLIVIMLLAAEAGYRIGCARHEREGEVGRGHFSGVQTSLLALLVLLLGFSFNMASVRLDTRRQAILDTATNLGAIWVRSGEFPEPQRTQFRKALREYLAQQADARMVEYGASPAELAARVNQAEVLYGQMWEIVRQEAREANPPRFVETLSAQLTDAQSLLRRRIYAYLNRVPDHVLILLFCAAMGAAGVVGLSAGLAQRHGRIQVIALTLFVCGTIYVILELDRPATGVRVDQSPLLQLGARWDREAAVPGQ